MDLIEKLEKTSSEPKESLLSSEKFAQSPEQRERRERRNSMTQKEILTTSAHGLKHIVILFAFTGLYRENVLGVLEKSGDGNAWENFLGLYYFKHQLAAASITAAVSSVLAYSSVRLRQSFKTLRGYPQKPKRRRLPQICEADYQGPFYWNYPDRDFRLSDTEEPDINPASHEGKNIQEPKKKETG